MQTLSWIKQPGNQWYVKVDDVRLTVEPLDRDEHWVITFAFGPGRMHMDIYVCDTWYETKQEAIEAAERLIEKIGANMAGCENCTCNKDFDIKAEYEAAKKALRRAKLIRGAQYVIAGAFIVACLYLVGH